MGKEPQWTAWKFTILQFKLVKPSPFHTMTHRKKAQLRASIYALSHDIAGGLLLAGLTVVLAFLFSVK